MDYTMDDVDEAIVAILGRSTFDALHSGSGHFNRPGAMDMAAIRCFLENRSEDRHVLVLRASLQRLNRTGVILPPTSATTP